MIKALGINDLINARELLSPVLDGIQFRSMGILPDHYAQHLKKLGDEDSRLLHRLLGNEAASRERRLQRKI